MCSEETHPDTPNLTAVGYLCVGHLIQILIGHVHHEGVDPCERGKGGKWGEDDIVTTTLPPSPPLPPPTQPKCTEGFCPTEDRCFPLSKSIFLFPPHPVKATIPTGCHGSSLVFAASSWPVPPTPQFPSTEAQHALTGLKAASLSRNRRSTLPVFTLQVAPHTN